MANINQFPPTIDHNYALVADEEQLEKYYQMDKRSETYVKIPGVHRGKDLIKDNLGYVYFKSKSTEAKVYMRCNGFMNGCPATGSIITDLNGNKFTLRRLHNHQVREDDTQMKQLRSKVD